MSTLRVSVMAKATSRGKISRTSVDGRRRKCLGEIKTKMKRVLQFSLTLERSTIMKAVSYQP